MAGTNTPQTRHRRRQREARAWQLRLAGLRGDALCDALAAEGFERPTRQGAAKMIRRVEARVLRDFEDRARAELARQVGRLNLIADEAMRAWERSRREARRIAEQRAERVGSPADAVVTTLLEVRSRIGDPAYLRAALAALDDLRDLLGLNPGGRHARRPDTPPAPPRPSPGCEVSDEDIERLLALASEPPDLAEPEFSPDELLKLITPHEDEARRQVP